MFSKKYNIKKNATLVEKIIELKMLSESNTVSSDDKKQMKSILKTLNKIRYCELCRKEINWDKEEGLYTIWSEVSARCKSCHKIS
jgi:hypothetical protein